MATVRASMHPREETAPPGQASTLHYHEEIELLCVLEGEFSYVVHEKEYVARAGDVVFVNSGVLHSCYRKTNCRTGVVQFCEAEFVNPEIMEPLKYTLKFQSRIDFPIVIIKNNAEFFSCVEKIIKEATERTTSYEIFIKAHIYQILANLYRSKIMTDPQSLYLQKETQRLIPVLSYINENCCENLTLDEISRKMDFDRSYFCRVFKIATGATFTEYLNFVRICKAERMLVKTHESISQISASLGFSEVTYFDRIFKRYIKYPPRIYRTVVCCSV